jgi:DnaJ-class molecular chaperone
MGKLIQLKKCDRCKGTGKVIRKQIFNSQTYDMPDICPQCKGRRIYRPKPKRVWGYTVEGKK